MLTLVIQPVMMLSAAKPTRPSTNIFPCQIDHSHGAMDYSTAQAFGEASVGVACLNIRRCGWTSYVCHTEQKWKRT